MQIKSQKIRQSESFRDHINLVLENRGDDADDEWWDDAKAREELERLACAEDEYVSSSERLKITSERPMLLAVYQKDCKALFEQIGRQAAMIKADKGLHLLFFVRDMRSRIKLEQYFAGEGKQVINAGLQACGGKNRPLFQCTYILVQKYGNEEACLRDLKRYEILQMPPVSAYMNRETAWDSREEESLYARVLTADLFQLVELYNTIGDRLFRNNVRIGLNEMLGVDQSIRETLKTEPEHFWYKNNGITILAERDEFRLRSLDTLVLDRLAPEREPAFSVINGAQTITASARYFFETEFQYESSPAGSAERERLKAQLNKSKRAQVLVRVIYVPQEDPVNASGLAREISTALNRQKPVKIEDIAFTAPFVEKLAGYLERGLQTGQTRFRLIRRGEGGPRHRQMELISFARAALACAGKPAEARSQGANTLLKFHVKEDGTYEFQQKEVFADAWMKAEAENEEAVFKRLYGAVWFTDQLAQKYEGVKKGWIEETPEVRAVIRNGKWYFTAAVVQILNGFTRSKAGEWAGQPDFSGFSASVEETEEKLTAGIRRFGRLVALFIKLDEGYGDLDSNLFKKNEAYNTLIKRLEDTFHSDRKGPSAADRDKTLQESRLEVYLQEFIQLFCEPVSLSKAEAAAALQPADSFGGMEDCIILRGMRLPAESMAEAMQKTVKYVLEQYPDVRNRLSGSIANWLSTPGTLHSPPGYFRGNTRKMTVDGVVYELGTFSNTETKLRQMRQLCRLAGVRENEIFWYQAGGKAPVFSW